MKRIFILLCLFISSIGFGQDSTFVVSQDTTVEFKDYKFKFKNNIQFELLGTGGLYSVNYERFLVNRNRFKTSVQLGISPMFRTSWNGLSIPISITELFSFKKHHLELGIGIAPNFVSHENHGNSWESLLNGRVGYRFQKPSGRFVFRAGYTPFLYFPDNKFIHWGGISIGYSF